MADELTPETIAAAALAPQSASVDGTSVSARSIDDQIKALEFAKTNAALAGTNPQGGSRSVWGRCRPGKVVPPGGC